MVELWVVMSVEWLAKYLVEQLAALMVGMKVAEWEYYLVVKSVVEMAVVMVEKLVGTLALMSAVWRVVVLGSLMVVKTAAWKAVLWGISLVGWLVEYLAVSKGYCLADDLVAQLVD
jgi:hypothetical protein